MEEAQDKVRSPDLSNAILPDATRFLKRKSPGVIDPRDHTIVLGIWDIFMVLALAFTALITPYEIAFVENVNVLRDGPDAMWVINRVVDVFFFFDILMSCSTMYELPLVVGGMWVGRRSSIIMNYLRSGWLLIDVISIFPFFAIEWLISGAGDSTIEAELSTIRLIKLFRMLKLSQTLKAFDRVLPFFQEFVMGRLEWTLSGLKMVELFIWLIWFTHLQACFWGLFPSFTTPPTWISTFKEGHLETWGEAATHLDLYQAAFYFSAMTVTSIGYGEMLPMNSNERMICAVLMLLSGMVWTYILSKATSIAATLNPNETLYNTTMDQLNVFVRERNLPQVMRRDLRLFFDRARQVREVNDDTNLLDSMSPMLRGTVAYAANRRWVQRIWYLHRMGETRESREFIASLASTLMLRAYIADERPALGQLYVIRRGMCVKNWRFMRAGQVFGDDIIIDMSSKHLLDHSQAVAITYIETFTLTREALKAATERFPVPQKIIQLAAVRLRMRRALLMWMCDQTGQKVRSWVPERDAEGYEYVTQELTVEQRLQDIRSALAVPASKPKPNLKMLRKDSQASISAIAPSQSPSSGGLAPLGLAPLGLAPLGLAPLGLASLASAALNSGTSVNLGGGDDGEGGGAQVAIEALGDRITAIERTVKEQHAALVAQQRESHAALLTRLDQIGSTRRIASGSRHRRSNGEAKSAWPLPLEGGVDPMVEAGGDAGVSSLPAPSLIVGSPQAQTHAGSEHRANGYLPDDHEPAPLSTGKQKSRPARLAPSHGPSMGPHDA